MERKNVCEFSDLLSHAEREFGIPWNRAHQLFVNEGVYQGNVYIEDIEAAWEEEEAEMPEVVKMLISFAKKHGVTEFYILPKD